MTARKSFRWFAFVAVLIVGSQAFATMVQQMNLGEMTDNAANIIRGKITEIETGTVTAGGAELPTITYIVRVADVLKGSAATGSDNLIRVTMFGSLKTASGGGEIKRSLSMFEGPSLQAGNEYLLFLTSPSSICLSTTVGVGQGSFRFLGDGTVVNEAKNNGLFRDMDRNGMPASGPINYADLADRIQQLVTN